MLRLGLIYLGRQGMGGPLSAAIARGLAQRGWPVRVLRSAYGDPTPWHDLPVPTHAVPTYWGWLSFFQSLMRPHGLTQALHFLRGQVDLLLFPMFHPWNALLQRHLGLPTVAVVHDPHPHPMLYDRLAALVERQSLRQATRRVALSQAMAQVLARQGFPPQQTDIAPLERLLAYPIATPPGPSFDPPTVLFFGRLTPYKGLPLLLQAMNRVWQEIPNARLVIAGSGDLHTYARGISLRRPEQMEVLNHWIPESAFPTLFGRASVVALPYLNATQSGVAVLAASFALPIVATTTGALPEQVQHGLSGWLVPPQAVAPLAEALLEALTHPAETRRRGAALWEHLASPRAQEAALAALEQSLHRAAVGTG